MDLIDEGRRGVCGSIPTIEKVGKNTQTFCPDPHPDPESFFENPDPLDPDPHQNPTDPHPWFNYCTLIAVDESEGDGEVTSIESVAA